MTPNVEKLEVDVGCVAYSRSEFSDYVNKSRFVAFGGAIKVKYQVTPLFWPLTLEF